MNTLTANAKCLTYQKLLGVKCGLKHRITVNRCDLKWAQKLVTEYHYLHRPIHPLSIPFAYSISLDDVVVGTIIMATPHFTRKKGLFGYEGLPTKWQVLQIARLWIEPKYQIKQSNGHASNIASCAIAKVLRQVNDDWLEHHPPRFPDQPHHIKLIISYADTSVDHQGTIYQAVNFQKWGETTNNRPRHGKSKGSKESKILYVYRLDRKSKSSSTAVLLGGDEKLLKHKRGERSSYSKELSIPCLIKQPHKKPFEGLIVGDRGSKFDVKVDDRIISLPKLYVFPHFPSPKKCRTDDDISPRKISRRRKKGTGSGYINWRDIEKNGKSYKETWFHYELWDKGRQVKSCVYIPKKMRSQIQKMNAEKVPVEEILEVLKSKKKKEQK